MRRAIGLVSVVLASAVLLGCGGPKVEDTVSIKGKLVNGGQPVSKEGEMSLFINFYLIGDDGKVKEVYAQAPVNEDGTFETELTPGKYKVEIAFSPEEAMMAAMRNQQAQGEGAQRQQPLPFGGKFSAEKTPIEISVSSAQDDLVFDLGKY